MSKHPRVRRIGVEVSEDDVIAHVRAALFGRGAPCFGTYCAPMDSAYYVTPEVFRKVLCAGFNPLAVGRLLARRGVLRLMNGYSFQHRATLPSGRVAYMYVIQPEPLGIEAWCPVTKDGAA